MTLNGWTRWMPGLRTLEQYQLAWLPHDIIAGLVLTTMLVPVGIAYAVASGVPGIYGLYATIVPLIAYALFGPSRIMVLGPDSSLAAIILGVIVPLSGGDPMRAVALAGAMAIVSGTACILAGVMRLGFVTELLLHEGERAFHGSFSLSFFAAAGALERAGTEMGRTHAEDCGKELRVGRDLRAGCRSKPGRGRAKTVASCGEGCTR